MFQQGGHGKTASICDWHIKGRYDTNCSAASAGSVHATWFI
jgi:hypothetical protein